MLAISVVAGVVGLVAVIDLAFAREVDLGTRVLLGALALVVPIVGVPVWGFTRGGWQRIVTVGWLGVTLIALINLLVLLPSVRHG